jgi:hypothetical protein
MRPRHIALLLSAGLSAVSAFAQSPACDDTAWKHVYKPDRLTVKEKCVQVTGTIVDATATEPKHRKDGVRHEADGDTHGWLKLDPGQEKFLNAGNKQDEGGNLVFEVVCNYKVTQADAKGACVHFKNAIKIPPVGTRVAIIGSWVQDSEHDKWFEIHPVSTIAIISSNAKNRNRH